MTIETFRFAPPAPAEIDDLRRRLASRRVAPATADPDGDLGIDPVALERLSERFAALDWYGFAERCNHHAQFTADVAGERLHFVHLRSPDPDAIPLLLLHGWPGSFLEFNRAIDLLAQGTPAFHIVCPSLPGYGFSTRPLDRAVGPAEIADIMAGLMTQLGYARFVAQGGDWGSIVASQIARRHADRCVGLHLNMLIALPPPQDDPALAQVTPEEAGWLRRVAQFQAQGSGYQAIQSTRPQTLAVALADSPAGLLAWIGEKFLAWSGRDAAGASLASDEAIVDHAALYWVTNSIGTSIRLYLDEARTRAPLDYVTVPTGAALYPNELYKPPRAWAERAFNIVHWAVQDRGGHFAAMEVPQLFVADLRAFVGELSAV